MSRRKQSNPKPLKAGEEEEWGSEGEAERNGPEAVKRANTPSGECKSSPSPAKSPSSTREESSTPKLRLNASLATDPAVKPPQVKVEAGDYLATALPHNLQTAIAAGRFFCLPPLPADGVSVTRTKTEVPENRQAGVPVYICSPCGIRFSSLSTLEAHQTYYCSHRHNNTTKSSTVGGGESEAEDIKPIMDSMRSEDVSGGESTTSEPPSKSVRSGKQYRCPHCSYSADKKVSLNRHMRMHSSSPASQSGSVNTSDAPAEPSLTSLHLVDRYCQDCDIRFSSLKTFRAHKLHYCSTRHVIKSNKPSSAPSSPTDSRTTPTSPGASDTSSHPQQPYLALPTNPTLIIPYSLFQGASILPAPAVGQETVYSLLPDGTLQPVAQGIISHPRFPPSSSAEGTNKQQKPSAASEVQVPKQSEEFCVKVGLSEGTSPLDLSCRRSAERELEIEEDEKENRRSVDNQINIFPSPDPEDIICAPSIPLMLSTSSTCSSPSPAPISPALSSSSHSTSAKRSCTESKRQRLDSQSNSSSPKSPHRTLNGLPNLKQIKYEGDLKRKTSEEMSPPKNEGNQNNINISNLLLAAAQSHHIDGLQIKPELSNLPFSPELISQLSASINSRFSSNKTGKGVIPGLIPTAGIPVILPQMGGSARPPTELLNPANILPLLTSEMALRIAAATGSDLPAVPPAQVLVKQGVSKCQECNIVFCKHENYVAHKKHYCSARQIQEASVVQDDNHGNKPLSPTVPTSPPVTSSSPVNSKEPTSSPVSAAASTNISIASTSKPTLYQFICAACGIKFTSYDNLTAHQMYYCPKRIANESDKTTRRCPKCKVNIPLEHLANHQCGGVLSGWKCPCCPVISPTASAAQKHMDTHSSVKAFLCTICRYKGNTLRGMRTHIRMHFEKRTTEIMEENYITCVLEDGSGGNIEVTAADKEDSYLRSTDNGSCNGDNFKIKEENMDGKDEDEEEYIEVEEVNTVKESLPIICSERDEKNPLKLESQNDKRKKVSKTIPNHWCSNKRLNGRSEPIAHDSRGPIVL
uniref:C2H2-type domain-containing protein n=1 Tax=Clastoptera arizonana TaxID=38151 RepID=A0A1B6CLP5_9HEMI